MPDFFQIICHADNDDDDDDVIVGDEDDDDDDDDGFLQRSDDDLMMMTATDKYDDVLVASEVMTMMIRYRFECCIEARRR